MTNFRALCGLRVGRRKKNGPPPRDDEASANQSVKAEQAHTSASGTSNEAYHYQPLDQSVKDTFRLATLLPGPKNSQPRLTLSDSTWQNGNVSYEALSYVWGNQHTKKTIILNGSNFEVTENLYSALNHLRFEDRSRGLWIDAICIDQTSITERNHQVAVMAEIYENCQKVIVWLGDENEETEFLATFIRSAIEVMQEKLPNEQVLPSFKGIASPYLNEIPAEVIDGIFRPDLIAGWRCFLRVLRRQWWNRAWVVQEFATAPDATFYIGRFSFDWRLICALIITLNTGVRLSRFSYLRLDEGQDNLVNIALDIYFSRLNWTIKRYRDPSQISLPERAIDFLSLLRGQCGRNCGDRRDKVYSILSMTDPNARQVLHPDYSKSAPSIYIATVKAYISIFKNLNILGYNTHEPSPDCPSWCPDWSKITVHRVLNVEIYKASATTAAVATFSEDDSTIYIKGFHVGTVIEDCVQDSSLEFSNDLATLNWDLRLMAKRIKYLVRGIKSGLLEAEYETCAISVAQTLVAGSWENSHGQVIECPPPVRDPVTGEWWLGDDKRKFIFLASHISFGRTVIFCDDKRVGLAPQGTTVGDEIWIFVGAATPFIIRRIDGGAYKFIGNCYVHGIMQGELMEDLEKGRYELRQVAIR